MANYVTQENLVTYNTQIKSYINDQDKKVVAAAKNYINTAISEITPATIGAEAEGSANNAQINANAYTDQKIADLVDLAPETMDTLKELADAIKNNGDAVTAINSAISNKVDKEEGKALSANDFTDEYKAKLESLNNSGNGGGKNYVADNNSIRWELHTCYGNKVNADDPTDIIKVKFDTPVVTIAKEPTSTETGIKRFTASCEGFEDSILNEVIDSLADWESDKQGTLVASGTEGNIEWSIYDCGKSTVYKKWSLDSNTGEYIITDSDPIPAYTFYLEGTGAMKTYGSKNQPWYTYRKYMHEVRVGRDITTVEPSAFYPCNLFLRYKVHPCNTTFDSRGDNGLLTLTATDLLAKYPSGRKEWELTIPSLYSAIGANVFSSNGVLEGVVIPYGIKEIQENAFSSSRISDVTISPSVKIIGEHAFESCSSLKEITVPASVKEISDYCFSNCYNMETVNLKGTEKIGSNAFSFCSKLKNIAIPDSVTHIGSAAFSECEELTTFNIGKNVKKIGSSAFSGIPNVKITISDENNYYYTIGDTNAIAEIETGDLIYCDANTSSTTIPAGAIAIGEDCFIHNWTITEVTIPEGVTRIRNRAFAGCKNLKTINLPSTFTGVDGTPFTGPNYDGSYKSNYYLKQNYAIPFTKVTYRGNTYEGTRDEINAALLEAYGFQLI